MLDRLRKRLPRFSIGSLFLLTSAVAIGFAVSQSPSPGDNLDWSIKYTASDFRVSEGFICTGSVLIAIEFICQAWFVWKLRSSVQLEHRFSIYLALFLRVVLASGILLLTMLRLLLNQDILSRSEWEGYNHVFGRLWPDILLNVTLILAIRMMLVPRTAIQSAASRWFRGVFVIVGMFGFLGYAVIDRAVVPALVHMRMDSVESNQVGVFQRRDVYPNHAAEGFASFWESAMAATAVLFSISLLLICSGIKDFRVRSCLWVVVLGLISVSARYVWWFYAHEFHRISPELAGAGLAHQWWKAGAGLVLVVGVALSKGTKSGVRASELLTQTIHFPKTSILAIVGAISIAISAGWNWVWLLRESLEGGGWLYGWQSFRGVVCTIGSSLLYPELVFPLALFVSACSLIWQSFSEPDNGPPLILLEGRQFALYSVAWLAVLLVGIPTFAIFGFCYWLGPWVL